MRTFPYRKACLAACLALMGGLPLPADQVPHPVEAPDPYYLPPHLSHPNGTGLPPGWAAPDPFYTPLLARPGYWQPGGYEARIGSPYYYSAADVGDMHTVGGMGAPYPGPGLRPSWPVAGRYGDFGPDYGHHFYGPLGQDPYTYHFGPGFYRRFEYGHSRFPYYNYRAPWYFPGPPVYSRDTNFPW